MSSQPSSSAPKASATGFMSAVRSCGYISVFSMMTWILLLAPAWFLGGMDGLQGMTVAALLCVIPGCLVFLLWGMCKSLSSQSPMLILAATPFRMLFVLVGVLVIHSIQEKFGFSEFTVWVLVFYPVTLFLETFLVLRQFPSSTQSQAGTSLK